MGRFATGLGLGGCPAPAGLCQERLRAQAQTLRRLESVQGCAAMAGESPDLRSHAAALDQANIARTFARIDPDAWDAIVGGLAEAPAVYVLGLRRLYAPAHLLGLLLRLARDGVRTLTPGPGTLADEVGRVRTGDAFVAMSIHRYMVETVRAVEYAAGTGAVTFALTDSPASPLARCAGTTLYVDTSGAGAVRSLTAFVSVVQALAADVAVRRGADTRSALLTEDSVLEAFGTYLTDSTPPR